MKNGNLLLWVIILLIFVGVWFFSKDKKMEEPVFTPAPLTTTSVYKNNSFGFTLILPETWKGYSETTEEIEYGHKVTLIHPLSTQENPRMNIPILIYPLEQWNIWQENNFEGYPTAAPIGPTERGRNDKYVFATAPRYNFSFSPGWEEVEDIIKALKGYNIPL